LNLNNWLNRLCENEKIAFEERLRILASASGVGYQIANNLHSESRLSESAFDDIMQGILQSSTNPEEIKNAYIEKCRRHILQGGAIPKPWASCYGRAVTDERFYETMVKLNYFRSERHARHSFQRLLSKPSNVARRRLQNKDLGCFVMWATFNPDDLTGHPFTELPSDADGIRARLGLSPNERGKNLLLFVYELPDIVEPLFPTIADAQEHSLFRPAQPGEKWGLTMPWPEIDKEVPRPEVVHKPITGAYLAEPIKVAKAREI